MTNKLTEFSSANFCKLPLICLGTYQIKQSLEIENTIDHALSVGYRAIDTASVYRNEHHIGNCLTSLLKKYNLTRSDIFITTKLGPKDHGFGNVVNAVNMSLSNLHTDYIDLYLVHWPGKQGLKQEDPVNKKIRKESWLELESIYKSSRKIKYLGVSNFKHHHLLEMMSYASILPAVVQDEFHPDYQDYTVLDFCKRTSIQFQSYSPLGSSHLCSDERFRSFSVKYNKTIAQLLLRWNLQKTNSVVPKSVIPLHISENFKIFDFSICKDDVEQIAALGKNLKYCWDSKNVC